MSAESKIAELNLVLPPAPQPLGLYRPAVILDKTCYLSGHVPTLPDGTLMTGRVGLDVDQQVGFQAAHQTGLTMLATLRASLASLDRVKRVVKLLGMVNAVPEFVQHPAVINGCSELFAQIWGEQHGVGARSAAGMASLPGNICVEIEAIFELH